MYKNKPRLLSAISIVLSLTILSMSFTSQKTMQLSTQECHFFTNIGRNVCVDSDTPVPTPTTQSTSTKTPTATETNLVETNTPVKTNTPVNTPTKTFTPQPTTTQVPGNGMWISTEEIMSLPMSGSAWNSVRAMAYGSWGTADLKNQDNRHAINTLAGALVYARTNDAVLRSKVRDAIIAAKRTMDESADWQTTNGVLATGRQLGAYVVSADLINLKSYDTAANTEFKTWLGVIRTTNIGTHGRWKNLTFTCENAAANWGAFACASRIAASIYVGDTADVQRASLVIRAFFGERSVYPIQGSYFQHTSSYNSSWICGTESTWTGVNPPCVKSGINIDGTLVEDASRGGGCCTLQGDGNMYSWQTLQGLFFSTELLYRAGYPSYDWSNKALKRALDFVQRAGWNITNVSKYVPWLSNFRYGTNYPVASNTTGQIMSWSDWLYNR